MKINVLILLAAFFTVPVCFHGQSADEIFSRSLSAASSIQNGFYTAMAGIKYATRNDTAIVKGSVRFEKNARDSVIGYKFDIRLDDQRYLYDGRILTSAYYKDSLKIIHDRWIYPINISGKLPFRLLHDYFTGNLNTIKEIPENKALKKTIQKDTVIGSKPCIKIQVTSNEGDNFENKIQCFYFSKADYLLMGYSLSFYYLNRNQFQFIYITESALNHPGPDRQYEPGLVPEVFYTKRYQPDKIERLLTPGTPAPFFTLTDTDGKTFYSPSADGKILVLYFWHMFSPEARQFLSAMEELSRDFEGAGVLVIGLNVKEPDIEGMKKYLKRKSITFRQLVDARITAMKYNVQDYPAFYIIGRNGKVIDAFYDMKTAGNRITQAIKRNL